MNNNKNNNSNKSTTFKTLLMLSITSMMLILGGIIPVDAAPGDTLLTINNPTPESDERFGVSIADINGDILVGAYHDNTGAIDAGSAYLFDGITGNLLLTINNPTPESGDDFGHSVVGTVGDNILVSAWSDNTGAIDAGSVYLFNGTDGSLLLTINNPIPEQGDFFGDSVAGTINGNILVGATNDNTGATNAGSAYLFDGITGNLLLTINNPTPEQGDQFGISITSTHTGNILVGAYSDNTGASQAGSAYLFDGITGNLLLTINNPTPEQGDQFGISVASTLNGDLLIGALADDTGANSAGSAYLFNATDGNLLLTINNPTPESYENFGYAVAGTDDDNILVSARYDNAAGTQTGATYLFDIDGNLLLTINNPTPELNDQFGISVAGTTNGNILVGADSDNTGAIEAGSAYLFEGISPSTPAPIITSILADDPDDLDNVYSIDDTITITFDSDTNIPGGTGTQTKTAVDDLFTFTESLGQPYRGQWIAADTFTITINGLRNAGPPVIGITTVTPSGITPILSADGTSAPSYITSPVLSGDFGIIAPQLPPIITSLIADDPDDLDDVYSIEDTITITFDSDTNTPGGVGVQTKTAVDDLYNFTDSLGETYTGQWIIPDTFEIIITNTTGATPPVINDTTVTPTGITPILSSDETSIPSSSTSPVLSGDFGVIIQILDWILGAFNAIYYDAGNVGIGTDNPNSKLEIVDGYFELDTSSGVPPTTDCDEINEIGRMKVDDSTTDLYICTSSGWVTK